MTDKQITIRMPRELLDRWLAALRGGEYKQARRYLQCGDGYCCLGVLQMVADGRVECDTDSGDAQSLPSDRWKREHHVEFAGKGGVFNNAAPHLPTIGDRADWANDKGATFTQIADAIEACAEGY